MLDRLVRLYRDGDRSVLPEIFRAHERRGYSEAKEVKEFSDLAGFILASAEMVDVYGEDQIHLKTIGGREFVMYHCRDCCENVRVEDINGDLGDLVLSEILTAAESVDDARSAKYESDVVVSDDSATWTFYHLRTHAGDVTIRWLGESNGYYSERVNFAEIKGGRRIVLNG